MKYIIIIPARAGSKRLPNKNIQPFGGSTLLQHTIDQAKAAGAGLHSIVVSSDLPLRMPGLLLDYTFVDRPPELASDEAQMIEVVRHAVRETMHLNSDYEAVLLLQPTSPLRSYEDILEAMMEFEMTGGDALISVTETRYPEVYTLGHADRLRPVERPYDARKLVVSNGAIYLLTREALERGLDWWTADTCYAYEMPASRSVDIDTLDDLELARKLWNKG